MNLDQAILVGSGSYANVYSMNMNSGIVALKVFDDPEHFDEELNVARAVQNVPYCIRYIGDTVLVDGRKAILYECANCNAFELVRKKSKVDELKMLIHFLVDTVEKMRLDHIAHCDIKLENILVFDRPHGLEFKMGDLATMCRFSDNARIHLPRVDSLVRSSYVPEVLQLDLQKDEYGNFYYSSCQNEEVQWIDMYCAALVMYWAVQHPRTPEDPDEDDEVFEVKTRARSALILGVDICDPVDAIMHADTFEECLEGWTQLVQLVHSVAV